MDAYRKTIRTSLAELLLATLIFVPVLSAQQTSSSNPPESVPVVTVPPQAEASSEAKPAQVTDSPLVRAARKTSAARKQKSRIHINDASVKKSKGKLVEISSSNQHKLPPVTTQDVAKLKADQANRDKASAEATARLERARSNVAELEKEMSRLEEEYYGSDDPTSRDQVIEPRFNKTKDQLAKARAELDSARDAAGQGSDTTSSHP